MTQADKPIRLLAAGLLGCLALAATPPEAPVPADPDDHVRKRIATALLVEGVPQHQIREVLVLMQPMMEAVRRDGSGFELDSTTRQELAGLGLTDPQIQAVVKLARQMAHRTDGGAASPSGVIRDRTARELEGIGLPPDLIPQVLDVVQRIPADEGPVEDEWQPDPATVRRLADLGLTAGQIDAVIRLVRRTTSRSSELTN